MVIFISFVNLNISTSFTFMLYILRYPTAIIESFFIPFKFYKVEVRFHLQDVILEMKVDFKVLKDFEFLGFPSQLIIIFRFTGFSSKTHLYVSHLIDLMKRNSFYAYNYSQRNYKGFLRKCFKVYLQCQSNSFNY